MLKLKVVLEKLWPRDPDSRFHKGVFSLGSTSASRKWLTNEDTCIQGPVLERDSSPSNHTKWRFR